MVLELTLKHVKALGAVLEQQQQKIIELQKNRQISKCDAEIILWDLFHSSELIFGTS